MQVLPPIPPDLIPTDEEIQEELNRDSTWARGLPPDLRRRFAEMGWELRRRKEAPDAFWHPFAPDAAWYQAYLQSPTWKQIRKRVLERAAYRCEACSAKATEVHHRCYRPRILAGQDTSLLVAL